MTTDQRTRVEKVMERYSQIQRAQIYFFFSSAGNPEHPEFNNIRKLLAELAF